MSIPFLNPYKMVNSSIEAKTWNFYQSGAIDCVTEILSWVHTVNTFFFTFSNFFFFYSILAQRLNRGDEGRWDIVEILLLWCDHMVALHQYERCLPIGLNAVAIQSEPLCLLFQKLGVFISCYVTHKDIQRARAYTGLIVQNSSATPAAKHLRL